MQVDFSTNNVKPEAHHHNPDPQTKRLSAWIFLLDGVRAQFCFENCLFPRMLFNSNIEGMSSSEGLSEDDILHPIVLKHMRADTELLNQNQTLMPSENYETSEIS